MKIIVNNTAASSGGAMTILKSFYNYLIESGAEKEHEWIFLLNDNHLKETDHIKVKVLDHVKKRWLSRLKFDLYDGKNYINELEPNVLFTLQNTIIFGTKCPQLLYMHQSLPFQKEKKFSFFKSTERKLAIYQYIIGKLIKESIKKTEKTIVQTEWIRRAVIDSTNVSDEKVKSILPPLDDLSKYKNNTPFQKNCFFYPAGNYVYKNHQCIFEATTILNINSINNFEIALTIDEKEKKRNITYLGKMPFNKVIEKYNSSTLIFPSYIETLGLPLLEARDMGTIILSADCPYSREALEGYENAYFFDPHRPKELAILIEQVIKGQIIKKNIKKSEIKIENSWKEVVDNIIEQATL